MNIIIYQRNYLARTFILVISLWLIFFNSIQFLYADPIKEKSLQRLFITPEQRLTLEPYRLPNFISQTKPQSSEQQNLQLQGIVIQDDGDIYIWVNGTRRLLSPQNVTETNSPESSSNYHLSSQNILIQLPESNRWMKPGQTLLIKTNEIVETYEVKEVLTVDSDLSTQNAISTPESIEEDIIQQANDNLERSQEALESLNRNLSANLK